MNVPFYYTYTATCIALCVGTLLGGLISKTPFAIGPGVAIASYMIHAMQDHHLSPTQIFLAALLASLIVVPLMASKKLCSHLLNDIPASLVAALVAGIGLLIMTVGIQHAEIEWTSLSTTVLDWAPLWIGLLVTALLDYNRIPGAIILGIISTTALLSWHHAIHIDHIFSMQPPSLYLPAFNWNATTWSSELVPVVFSLVIVTLFDCFGTLLGMNRLMAEYKAPPSLKSTQNSLLANALGCLLGSSLGTANTSIYIESAAGIRSGGRTGLTAIITAALFGATLFFAPIVKQIPLAATSPALIYVGLCMLAQLKNVNRRHWGSVLSALAVLIIIPLRMSIADGLGVGFILYTLLSFHEKIPSSKKRTLLIISFIFVLYFLFELY